MPLHEVWACSREASPSRSPRSSSAAAPLASWSPEPALASASAPANRPTAGGPYQFRLMRSQLLLLWPAANASRRVRYQPRSVPASAGREPEAGPVPTPNPRNRPPGRQGSRVPGSARQAGCSADCWAGAAGTGSGSSGRQAARESRDRAARRRSPSVCGDRPDRSRSSPRRAGNPLRLPRFEGRTGRRRGRGPGSGVAGHAGRTSPGPTRPALRSPLRGQTPAGRPLAGLHASAARRSRRPTLGRCAGSARPQPVSAGRRAHRLVRDPGRAPGGVAAASGPFRNRRPVRSRSR